MTSTVQTWRRLSASDRVLFIEALTLILALRAGLRVLPFTTVRGCLDRIVRRPRRHSVWYGWRTVGGTGLQPCLIPCRPGGSPTL